MQDLLQISISKIGAETINSINARDIHTYLEVKTRFNDWIQRAIEKYDFEENIDYSKMSNGTSRGIDFIVTLDMAKELAMLENNPKGRETRKYFINFEKEAKKVISSQSTQIQILQEMINQVAITDQRVTKLESNLRIENWQQKKLEEVKNQKVYEIVQKHDLKNDSVMIKKLHSRVWKSLKNRFSIPRYNELPICEFENGVSYIQKLTFKDLF
ncbi:MAG: antA/AntB antirepressor family protein, partial [Patescibacteria group bacterium]